MNFALSDDHVLLRDTAHDFLRKEVSLAPLLVPGASVEQAGYDRLWAKLAELGWPGLAIPEEHGGLGLSMVDLALVAGELGRFLAPAPLFGTLAGTWALLAAGSVAQKSDWLPLVAQGSLKLALAAGTHDDLHDAGAQDVGVVAAGNGFQLTGRCAYVVDAAAADKLVVMARQDERRRFFLVDRDGAGVRIETLPWRDVSRQVCVVHLADALADLLPGDAGEAWPWIRDRLTLVLAAESAGGLHAVLDDTAAYAKERVAFGRPIGAYQAIKHALADMLAQAECASTAVLYAAWALSHDHADASLAVAMAQSHASDAYREATHRSIQIFGAIGFTWEMKNHLYFKRARGNTVLLGAPATQRERLVRILEARAEWRPSMKEEGRP